MNAGNSAVLDSDRSLQRRRHNSLSGYVYAAPLLIWWGVIILYPLVRVLMISVTNQSPLDPVTRFVGLSNYAVALSDPTTRDAIWFSVVFALCSTALELVAGCGLALLLSRIRGYPRVLGVVMIPWAISEIVTATGGTWLFNNRFGMVNGLLGLLFGIHPVWLSDPTLARVAIIVLNSWEFMPIVCLFVVTALGTVPADLVEQMQVDRGNVFAIYRHVHWPFVRPVVIGIGMFVTALNLMAFALPFAMTSGGPGNSTNLIAYMVFETAIPGLQFGKGGAIAVIALLIALLVAAVGGGMLRRANTTLGVE